jgi:hypothetical protein
VDEKCLSKQCTGDSNHIVGNKVSAFIALAGIPLGAAVASVVPELSKVFILSYGQNPIFWNQIVNVLQFARGWFVQYILQSVICLHEANRHYDIRAHSTAAWLPTHK